MITNFLPQSSIASNPEMCGPNISLSGFQHLNICDDYAAEHYITFNCNKTFDAFFCPKQYKQPVSFKYYLQWCMCTIFGPSQMSLWIIKCLTEGSQ